MPATCVGSIERFFEPMHTTARAERVSHPGVQGYIARAATVPEGWPSGLRRTLGKRVYGKPYRGFESHSLRHRPEIHRFSGLTGPVVLAICGVVSARTSGLHGGRLASFYSLMSLFSPKLCTSAIWYKDPRVRIYGHPLEAELESHSRIRALLLSNL